MIQKIEAFQVPGRGTATESKIEVQSRFTTGDKAVIYYDLRDPDGTTPAFDLRIQDYITLPYAILSRSLIRVTGADRDAVVEDEKQAVEILKRERTDITVKAGGIKLVLSNDPSKACEVYNNSEAHTYYLDAEDLRSATMLYETEDMIVPIEGQYYVTDGVDVRFWNGKSFDRKFLEYCKI
jgi:hypothetical protein